MDELEMKIQSGKDFIKNRITELRLRANISEIQMSYDLGKSRSYIQEISAGKAMPSMAGFLNICDYFNVTPAEFFNSDIKLPEQIRRITKNLCSLPQKDLQLFDELIARYAENISAKNE